MVFFVKRITFLTFFSIALTGCIPSQEEMEKTVKFHSSLFPLIDDESSLRVSALSPLNSKENESGGVCGTAYYTSILREKIGPTRFILYLEPVFGVFTEHSQHLNGEINEQFLSDWNKNCI